MKTKLLTLASAILMAMNLQAQPPSIQWQKAFGGSDIDRPFNALQTADGGYIVAGYTLSIDGDVALNQGSTDFWVIKVNGSGTLQWKKTYGGSSHDEAYDMQKTSDGGYILAGRSNSNDGDVATNQGSADFWVVKLNATGTIQWEKTYGGSSGEIAKSIQQTTDGGYIVAGYTNSNDGDVTGNHGTKDFWVLKLDAAGTIQWQKALGGTQEDEARSIRQTTDGGYILTGITWSNDGDVTGHHGDRDFWTVKLNPTGAIQWQKTLGGSDRDEAFGTLQTPDGGYLVAGYTNSNDGDVTGLQGLSDAWVIKLDATGSIQWEKTLGGNSYEDARSIKESTGGKYIVAGFSSSSNSGDLSGNNKGGADFWVVELDATGNILWENNYGGSDHDYIESIAQTNDGGYIVTGTTKSNDGDVSGNHGSEDFWLVKLSPNLSTPEFQSQTFSIYPNPAKDHIYIDFGDLAIEKNLHVKITNPLGQKVYGVGIYGQHIRIPTRPWAASGLYFVTIYNENGMSITKKVIVR